MRNWANGISVIAASCLFGTGALVSCTGGIVDSGSGADPAGEVGGGEMAGKQSGGGPSGATRPAPDTVLRPLTRTEYGNSLRHLLGDNSQSENRLPADHPYVNGIFDNDAETLSSVALDLDAYESVAGDVVEKAFRNNRAKLLSGCDPVAAG